MFALLESDRLSWFRTEHRFLNYTEISSHEDYLRAVTSRDAASTICMLGNGSNCLFASKTVKAFLLKNKLAKELTWNSEDELWASSSVPLMSILKQCQKRSLDSFFYLSSVPATVGGAVAMNAGRGRGHNKTIFDYVQSVDVWTPEGTRSFLNEEIPREYRHTLFLDHPDWFIFGAKFKFPVVVQNDQKKSAIAQRVTYSQDVQDHSGPNCGSVFKVFYPRILARFRGVKLLGAHFSAKTQNWMINRSKSHRGALFLIRLVVFLHFVLCRKCSLEIRIVK